jgi:hypothetical protein
LVFVVRCGFRALGFRFAFAVCAHFIKLVEVLVLLPAFDFLLLSCRRSAGFEKKRCDARIKKKK